MQSPVTISNAIKYTKQGYIEIGYYPPINEKVRFYVKDTGVGIPEKRQKHILERFVKLDSFKQVPALGYLFAH